VHAALPTSAADLYHENMMQPTVINHIESKPGVCGGKPCIAGTRIRVQDIYVWHELQGQTADEIVSQFPQLTLAAVYAALAYYWDHCEQIQQQMKEADAFVEDMKKKYPSPLLDKLACRDGEDHSIPSG
jgi:uncharacterized protein (DUF433 family)